jgi:DNA-binding transcriptional LysR family regulator
MRYRAACQRAVQDLDGVEAELAAARAEPSGLVRLSLPPLFGTTIIAPALFSLSDIYPLLSLEIALHWEKVDLLSHDVDLALRIGALPDVSGLSARRFGMQNIVLCASAAYLEAHGTPQTIDDLDRHALIATRRNGSAIPWVFLESDGNAVSWTPPARLYLDGSALTRAAIRAGHGV